METYRYFLLDAVCVETFSSFQQIEPWIVLKRQATGMMLSKKGDGHISRHYFLLPGSEYGLLHYLPFKPDQQFVDMS